MALNRKEEGLSEANRPGLIPVIRPDHPENSVVVYYESIKRKLNKKLILDCRCDARLKAKAEGSTRLACTGWRGEL